MKAHEFDKHGVCRGCKKPGTELANKHPHCGEEPPDPYAKPPEKKKP